MFNYKNPNPKEREIYKFKSTETLGTDESESEGLVGKKKKRYLNVKRVSMTVLEDEYQVIFMSDITAEYKVCAIQTEEKIIEKNKLLNRMVSNHLFSPLENSIESSQNLITSTLLPLQLKKHVMKIISA